MNIYIRAIVFVLFIIFSMPSFVFAETHISANSIDSHTGSVLWSQEGSPYILDTDAYFSPGASLTINAGVTIFAATDTPTPKSVYVNGPLIIKGTKELPVMIRSIKSLVVSRGDTLISSLVMESSGGIYFNHATSTIISSIFSGVTEGCAICARASTISIRLSTIKNSANGIYSYYAQPNPLLVDTTKDRDAFGGLGNAEGDDPDQNHISIASSSIIGNISHTIYNETSNTIEAQNNWWGNATGPASGTLFGPINISPWLKEDPAEEHVLCCSNILFIPGFEGSRLYRDEKGLLGRFLGTSTNTLWEPNRNDDVRKLFMNASGNSLDSAIYTKDIIDSAFGFGIYKNFITMMNGVVAEKIINQWVAFPYDWRYSADTVVSGSDFLLNAVLSLASTSKTGKVGIVAHSNGGLVTKMLIKKMEGLGLSSLIDKIIFVAVPEFGTPQAIAGLLHGDKQSILGGLILSQSVARQMGEYSPGAYGLLPSASYFSNVTNPARPIVSFATSTLTDFHLLGNNQTISSYDALQAFLTGLFDHRPTPRLSDTNLPILLSASLLTTAQKIHAVIDNLSFPPLTRLVSLVGWGNPTTAEINYIEKKECGGPTIPSRALPAQCSSSLDYVASTTHFGDGTVVALSAQAPLAANSMNYYFDFGSQNKGKLLSDDHSTILNTDSGVAFLKQQITGQSTTVALPPYISDKKPTVADIHDDELIVTIHSPVELHMYDSQGRHTGLIKNQDPTSDLERYEASIPGSRYYQSDQNTHITLPYGTDYKVILKGTGTGSFGVDVVHNVNDYDVSKVVFVDMPVTPLLKAELFLSGPSFDLPTLSFDFDGDGTIDATTSPMDHFDENLNQISIRTIVAALEKDTKKRTTWLNKFDKVHDRLKKGIPLKYNIKKQQKFEHIKGEHWELKNLDSDHRDRLLKMYQSALDPIDID